MGPFARMLKEIRQESSKLQKGFILERYCRTYPWIQTAVKLTYDPFYQFYVKGTLAGFVDTNKPHLNTELDEKVWTEEVVPLLKKLNQRALNKASMGAEIGNLLGQLTPEDGEAVRCIILKDLRIGMASRGINGALAVQLGYDLIPVPDTQLCMTWCPELKDDRKFLWATPKINGLRGRWKAYKGGFRFLTREDYPLLGFDSIEAELLALCSVYHLTMVDGEVFSVAHPFQTIMSIARGNKKVSPQLKDELMYYIFNIQSEDGPFEDTCKMVDMMHSIDWSAYPHLCPVPYSLIYNDPQHIINKCREYSSHGWEGIVLRDPNIVWEAGKRNRNLMKYKLFYESDFTITGVIYGTEGKKWDGQVVALRCEGGLNTKWFTCNNGDHFRVPLGPGEETDATTEILPIRVDASCSSLTDEERKLITEAADLLIGKTAEVKFQAVTDKPDEEGYYSLQFPVFQKFKD